jgi:hypothetical protein
VPGVLIATNDINPGEKRRGCAAGDVLSRKGRRRRIAGQEPLMPACARLAAASILVLAGISHAAAQEPRVHASVRGGATIEHSEDGVSGTVPAAGFTVALPLNADWRGELEVWVPGFIKDSLGQPRHRDVVFSASAVRLLRSSGVRPYVVGGLSLTRTEDRLTLCVANRVPHDGGAPVRALVSCEDPDVIEVTREKHTGTSGYLLAGGGVEIPIGRRVYILADLRLSLAPTSVLVRPGVGVGFSF